MTGVFWIVAIAVFSIVEAVTSGLVSIWFAIGSLAGLITSYLIDSYLIQGIVFCIVSAISFILLRKQALGTTAKSKTQTDIGRLIGKQILITETVDNINNKGLAKINDVEWKVKSATGDIINAGETVVVEKIDGVKLIFK